LALLDRVDDAAPASPPPPPQAATNTLNAMVAIAPTRRLIGNKIACSMVHPKKDYSLMLVVIVICTSTIEPG
jgi:hypothetical protein